ncbi:MAG: recombinase family protein [Ruminococcus sp.]|nr:recombinase family protein [Ruminococcus sp.]
MKNSALNADYKGVPIGIPLIYDRKGGIKMRKIIKLEAPLPKTVKRKRVAAYARVSSGKDAMLHSLSAQISYYNNYIGSRRDWELVRIYADEALTGTKDDRPEFQQMLADCRSGKIDMIITKSLTRFARNTLTLLKTVRELKLLDIDVFFEKENIHTLSTDGELMLTLLASFAQEESRSASENQKWRIRKMFEQGQPNTGRMLGYRLKNGVLQIIPEEAEIVKMIFNDFLSGMGRNAIMKKLRRSGLPTINGRDWSESSVREILRNEKYTGNMLLQKTYILDHLSKRKMMNHGEKTMYFVENSHQPIIDKATFDRVQQELKRRAKSLPSKSKQEVYPFTELITCGICGKHYRRKITNAGGKYAKPVWICSTFNSLGKSACSAQQIPEAILIAKTSEMLKTTDWDRDTLIKSFSGILVPEHNRLVYMFKDGRRQEVEWQNPSRRESWTDEMKQAAREAALKANERRKKQ